MWRVALCSIAVLAMALSGCTDDPTEPAAPPEGTDSQTTTHAVQDLFTGDPALPATSTAETFTGTFEFQDNRQYMGDTADEAGQDWTNTRQHDLSGLVSGGAPFVIRVVADADTSDGDIDVWFEHDGVLASTSCDCPFGGHNELTAYSTGEAGPLTLFIQFDEIHSEPTDAGVPVQGFEYTIDVTVESDPRMIPPGIPLGVSFQEPDDHIMFDNATKAITVFDPDDVPVARLEGDHMFRFDDNMTAGEYVFVQGQGGAPATARFGTMVPDPPAPQTRFLDLTETSEVADVSGGEGTLDFDVPANVLETGACGFSGDAEVDPVFTLLHPDGSEWAEATDSGPQVLGWGACFATDLGDGPIPAGSWSAQYAGTIGEDAELFYWLTSYTR